MQSELYWVAVRTPVQFAAGCGARQRNGPTGGAANGTPFQLAIPSSTAPLSAPFATLTTGAAACALAAIGALHKAPPATSSK
jgi:hypothetical protein